MGFPVFCDFVPDTVRIQTLPQNLKVQGLKGVNIFFYI